MKLKLTENQLKDLIKESVQQFLQEAENGGWIVDSSEVDEAYNLAAQEWGNEDLNAQIVACLGEETLAQALAYIFRMNDFRKWKSRFEE